MRVKCVLIPERRCYLFPADTVCVHINRMHAHARTHSLFGYTVSSKKWTFVGKSSASSCGREIRPQR